MGDDENMSDQEEEYIPEGGIRIGDIYIPPPPAPACTFDSTGPRMIITHIENDFFKSYAGKQVLGPFHKSFTSIVGPNGSGKSNVIDSMLFVFGYRAQKIRSKKLSVLIHNSDTHPNVQSCTVSVHFQEILDKGEDFEVVPNTKIVVTRTAYKDNSSFYQVNGRRCQFKDVAKLLREKGIDLDHNRFLILQGEVESISLMKPKALTEHDTGMLEFLEDIIGTSRFKNPIEILSQRVAQLNEERVEKLNRVKLVEKEKDELEGPMKEAVGFLQLENTRTLLKSKLTQKDIFDSETYASKLEQKKAEVEASVSDLSEKLKEIHVKRKEKEKEMNSKGDQLTNTKKELEEMSVRFKKMEVEDTSLKEDIKATNAKRKKVMQLAKLEEERQEKLRSLPEDNRAKIVECEEARDKLEGKVAEEEENYETAMAGLRQETQVFQDEKEKHENKLMELRKGVDETQSELTIVTNELNIYTSAEQKEKIRLEQLQSSIDNTRGEVADKGSRLNELKKLVPAKEKELATMEKEAQGAAQSLEQTKANLQEVRMEYEEKKSAQNATKSHGKVHDALMAQKRNGNIPGVIARLGDLGAIDKKYDVAVSTAGGAALDNILVDTAQTGKQCIEFLRNHNVGRGSFLALEKTLNWQERADSNRSYPLGAPRLFDLIQVKDPSVRTAFYHYLQDTLVATDIDQANKIAYGAERFRVVTLNGELIEKVGTMTGGGRSKASGKMGQQVAAAPVCDPREMKKMETSIDSLDQEARELHNRKQKLEDDIIRLSKEVRELKREQGKLSVEVNPLQEQLAMLEGQVKEQESRVKETTADKKKVAELQKKVAAAEKLYHAACEKAETVEREVRSCDAKIKEITGSKIKSVQKKLDDSKKQLEKMKKEITRLEVEIKSGERELKKCIDKVENYETERTEYEESMKGYQERRKVLEKECSTILDKIGETSKVADDVSQEIKDLKVEVDDLTKEENSLKSNRIEVDKKLEEFDNNIREKRNRAALNKRHLKKLALQEVPGEEVGTLPEYSPEDLLEINIELLQAELNAAEIKINAARPNMAAIAEYKKKEEVYIARIAELDKMTQARDEQRKHHDDLRKQRLTDFMDGFGIITGKLKEMYQMITLGGDAELELVDSLDPFSEGIVFSVRPPKKSWKNISNLSGGEKTLSSLALVFALHYYKPTPLYVMDEIDAALDFKNVSIVANYIKERTKNAQFIIISLRSNMFELADRLVGIYKTYNCTKSVTINPDSIGQAPPPPPSSSAQSSKAKEAESSTHHQQTLSQPLSQPLVEMEIN